MDDPSGELAKQLRQMESTLKLGRPEFARALEEIEKAQSRSRPLAEEFAQIRDSAAARMAAQFETAASSISSEHQPHIDKLTDLFEQSQRGLAQASEYARAQALISDQMMKAIAFTPPHFDIPAFPNLVLPDVSAIDFKAFTKGIRNGAIRMADCGWTLPGWMIPREANKIGNSTESEIDDYFLEKYLGSDSFEGHLRRTSEELLKSAELKRWKALLKEVFQCLEEGQYKVCVPALTSVIEGFISESLFRKVQHPRKDIRPTKALAKTKWHEGEDTVALFWMSAVVFLDRLFAHSDFESNSPSFINRHWILHGRSATDWTAADALKLMNALATLHWLFED
jgi:hypothetical protein